jgi:hypothetical protein
MSSDMTPSERRLRARIAAHRSWQNTPDPSARTAPGRAANLKRFELEVDPCSEFPIAERKRRAEHARKAYYSALALKSAQARRRAKAGARAQAS